jgi:hypothetical protein
MDLGLIQLVYDGKERWAVVNTVVAYLNKRRTVEQVSDR